MEADSKIEDKHFNINHENTKQTSLRKAMTAEDRSVRSSLCARLLEA